ncbi:MAG: hypothetical protein KDI88_13175 [Gammaproteobacteria bacterium]|nr:hypothetical protein [Gammaproteobacteria bacterium]
MSTRVITVVVGLALVAVCVGALRGGDQLPESAPKLTGHAAEGAFAGKGLRRPPMAVATMRDTHATTPAHVRRPFNDVLEVPRAGARKAVPVTRGQELGLRFRPDERDPIAGQGTSGQIGQEAVGRFTTPGDSAFRPLPRERRRTYEDIQAESQAGEIPMVPAMPYPMLPLPPTGPGYWR